jgi:molybdenum-dependent DNA-binding transcriptional regulator ModE
VLTAFGHELVKRYRQIAAHTAKAAAGDIAAIRGALRPAAETPPE